MTHRYLCALAILGVAACSTPAAVIPAPKEAVVLDAINPIGGFVANMAEFDQFIATRPTPEQFRKRYPDVTLVMPGTIATKELRLNNSRYFAQMNSSYQIIGGRFQ